MFKQSVKFVLCALVLALALSGCADKGPAVRIVWPVPPAEPKLEYVTVFYSQDQFPKTGFEKFMELITGKPTQAIFRRPFGVVGDNQGLVYVSDPLDGNIRVYDFNRRSVDFYSRESMGSPYGLAMDSRGQLYVADTASRSVHVYSPARKVVAAIGGPEVLLRPTFLAVNDRLGRLYVTDVEGCKIAVFALDGRLLFTFGKKGGAEGEFGLPQAIAIDKENRVFVSEAAAARVQVFDADGKFLYAFGSRGDNRGQFEQPRGMAFDSEGNLYILDGRKGALLTFTPQGEFLLYTGMGRYSHSQLGFAVPTAIWIDSKDRLYITDTLLKRFSVWQYLSPAYLAEHPLSNVHRAELEKIVKEAEQQTAPAGAPTTQP